MEILHRGGRERYRGMEVFHNLIVQLVMSVYKTHQAIHLKRVILWYVNCTSVNVILTVVPSPPQVVEEAEHHTVFATSPVPWDPAAWPPLRTGLGSKEALQKGHFSRCPSD